MTTENKSISEDIVKAMKEKAIDNVNYKEMKEESFRDRKKQPLKTKNTLEKTYDNPFDARAASDEEDRKNLQEGRRTDMSKNRDFGYIKGNKYRD
tara:strand:+ start:359 stop:643 length:285 start_codon:yes stop_codon:yes gene_type:complete